MDDDCDQLDVCEALKDTEMRQEALEVMAIDTI